MSDEPKPTPELGDPPPDDPKPNDPPPTDPPPNEPPPKDPPKLGDDLDWRAHIPDDYKDATDWSRFKSVGDVLKSYAELEKLRGDSYRVPKSDAPEDEWTKLYERLRPATPEGYNVEFPTFDDAVTWPDDGKAWLKKIAHSIGLHERQLQAFATGYAEFLKAGQDAENEERKQALDALRGDFGPAYERNIGLANRAIAHLGGDELLEFVRDSGVGGDAVFVRAMFKLGEMLAEDDTIVGEVSGVMGRDEAKTRIAEIRADKEHAFHHSTSPHHQDALKEVERLYKLAYE